ncbi:SRD5A1 [Bugula neritina]|uniref:SRD5A1 n=1 Tax=Bugula neritina TaxID=10212 RepID=A0A7J7J9G5_BUGNE|nr:SRD5A1 [Bugula neritina]
MFITHYSHRSLIYPFLQKNKPHTTITVLSAFLYCSTNAFIQSCSLMILHKYDSDWFQHPTTILGTVLWGFGFFTNLYSDYQLRNLRKPGETGYKIPQGQFSQDLSSLCIPLVYAELSLL